MAFDEPSYRREVLDAGLPVQEDLRLRYQLPQQLSAPAVVETVQAVRACWRRQRTRLTYRAVIEELESGHLVHQALFEAAQGGDLAPCTPPSPSRAGAPPPRRGSWPRPSPRPRRDSG